MASFLQPIVVLVTTLLALEATLASPVAQPVQYGGPSVGALMSTYTTEVQYLHGIVAYLRKMLVS